MSSVSRSFAQISSRSKYLFVLRQSTNGGFTAAVLASAIAASPSLIKSYDGTVLNTTNFDSFLNGVGARYNLDIGDLYRDLGKQLHLYQNDVHVVTFTYCQRVQDSSGQLTEGVGSEPNIYICTWQAAGENCPNPLGMVKAVRTG
jgi:hypothetical protein